MKSFHSDGTECDGTSKDCVRAMHLQTDPQVGQVTVLKIMELCDEINRLSNRDISKPRNTVFKVAAVMLYCSKELVSECRKAEPDMDKVRSALAQSLDKIVDLTSDWVI